MKADVIRELIRRGVALEGLPSIQRAMRDNKVPNLSKKAGAKWRVSTIRRILQSEAIIGVLNVNIKVGVDENGKPIMQHVRIENFFPKICSDEDWVKLQARFAIHRGKGGRRLGHRINNLFPGRVFCAECGCPMGPGSTTGRDWDARAYTCINDQCAAKVSRFPVRVLEKDFFSMVLQQTPKQQLEDGAVAHECKRQMLMVQLADSQEKHAAAVAMALDQPKNIALRVKAKELYDTATKLEDELKGMEAATTLATHTDGGWKSVVKELGLPEALLTPKTAEQIVEFRNVWSLAVNEGRKQSEDLVEELQASIKALSTENDGLEGSLAAAKNEAEQLKQGKEQAESGLQRIKSQFEQDLNIANTALVAASGESAKALKQLSDSQSNHASQIAELQRQLSAVSEKAHDLELKLVRANALLEAKERQT